MTPSGVLYRSAGLPMNCIEYSLAWPLFLSACPSRGAGGGEGEAEGGEGARVRMNFLMAARASRHTSRTGSSGSTLRR